MKKISTLLILFCLFFVFGCNKQGLVHDVEASQQVEGVWEHKLTSETEIALNPDNPADVSGVVTSNSITTLSLNNNQSFSIETRIEFVSYEPKDPTDESSVPLDAMKDYFSQNVIVKGLFIATESVIQYDHVAVNVNNSEYIPFDDFAVSNPSAGAKIQTVSWRRDADNLYLTVEGDVNQSELVYSRVQ